MIQDERWLRAGVLAIVAAVGTLLLHGCGEPAPPPFDPATYEAQKKEVETVRMKEYGRTSLTPGKSRPKAARTR